MPITVQEFADFLQLKPMEKPGYKYIGSPDGQVGIFTREEMKSYMQLMKKKLGRDIEYKKCDISVTDHKFLYVCNNQKNKKEWNLYAAVFFERIMEHFQQPYFFLPVDTDCPAYCYINKEYAMIVAGMVYTPHDEVCEQYAKQVDIFDYELDKPESVQEGLNDFI